VKFAALACIIQTEHAFLVLIQTAKLAQQRMSVLLATIHMFCQEILASHAQMASILQAEYALLALIFTVNNVQEDLLLLVVSANPILQSTVPLGYANKPKDA